LAKQPGQDATLRRSLGLVELTLGGVGIILGAGIYALVGEAAGKAGDAVWISFAVAAGMAALTGLSYAELASAYPRAGADYEYTRQAFGRRTAAIVGWVIITGNLIAVAAVSLGFGGYFGSFVDVGRTLPAVVALFVAAAIAIYGIKQTLWASIALTGIEVAGLVFIVAIGVPHFGEVGLLEANDGAAGVFAGAALVAFAFIGFEQVATLSEEARNAPRTVPAALLLSIAVTTALYVAVAVAAVSVLGWERLSSSEAPLATVAEEALGDSASDALSVIALFSTFNTMLLLLVAASRLMYGMGTTGTLPSILGRVLPRFQTPDVAIALSLAIGVAIALLGDLGLVAQSANFAIFLGFIAVNCSLIALRFKQPDVERPFRLRPAVGKVPIIPVLALGAIVFMMSNLQLEAVAIGLGVVIAGAIATTIGMATSKEASHFDHTP
jgi:APA family basic amino acid/polyamine antiporter